MGSNPIPRTTIGLIAVSCRLSVEEGGPKGFYLASISHKLRYLSKNCDLNQPEKIKEYIAKLKCSASNSFENFKKCLRFDII